MHRAVAWGGVGLDLPEGEVPLALSTGAQRDEKDFSSFVALTDRRLFGRSSAGLVHAPYGGIQGANHEKRMLGSTLQLAVQGQWLTAHVAYAHVDAVARFIAGLAHIPPAQRSAGPDPLAGPSPQDPAGVRRALATMRSHDDRARFLYWLVEQGCVRGWLPLDAARDLVARVTLMHRAVTSGRAMQATWWLSVLAPDVLEKLFAAYFQPVLAHRQDGPLRTLDVGARGNSGTGAAVASSVVGIASLALLGVGWVSRPTGEGFDGLRFVITEFGGRGAFSVAALKNGRFAPIASVAPRTFNVISRTLADSEARLTLHRAMCAMHAPGFSAPPPTREALAHAVSQLFGPVDLTGFFNAPK
jgi:hypothetical protein